MTTKDLDPETEDEFAALRALHASIRTEADALFGIDPAQIHAKAGKMGNIRVVCGVDPGVTGAICIWDLESGRMQMFDMPTAHMDVGRGRNSRTRTITSAVKLGALMSEVQPRPDVAWLEDVASRPGQGVRSMFTFGRSVGIIEGVMGALAIPVFHVAPSRWTREFGVIGKSALHDGSAGRQPNSRAVARSAFPEYASLFERVKDNGRADAALIAMFGAKHATGQVLGKYRGERLTVTGD